MTKAEIINKIAEETGVAKKDVAATVEAFMEEIRVSLAENKENVYLRGFGTFVVKRRAQKTARNISKNTTIVIDAHDYPTFKPSKSFIEKMKNSRIMPNGKKKKGHKMATHKRKKRLRKNRHKSK